tara:strand:- start:496 stop:927 length:432 start_codon:yes stop_codon:yes gene_type:complete
MAKVESNTSESNIDFSKAKEVIRALINLFKVPSTPAPPVSKQVALSAVLRPGLDYNKIAANIISESSKVGVIIGENDDGSDNISEKMEFIRVKAICEAIISDARITIINLPGQQITATGGNAGGPVQVYGTSLTTSTGYGVMS